jgi:predicted AAA+ superfamily ATPase
VAFHGRYLAAQVQQDLQRKMVFVAGPRQVGKTTLAKSLPHAGAGYLSWDIPEQRERILRRCSGALPSYRPLR